MHKIWLLLALSGCGGDAFVARDFLDQWLEPDYGFNSFSEDLYDTLGETCALFDSNGTLYIESTHQDLDPYDWKSVDHDTVKVPPLGRLTVEPHGEIEWTITFKNVLSQYDGSTLRLGPCEDDGGGGGIRTHAQLSLPTEVATRPLHHLGTPPNFIGWHGRKDSNPQSSDLESDALPIELRPCMVS